MATLTLIARKGQANVFTRLVRVPSGTKVIKFYTEKTGEWVSKDNIAYLGEDRIIFNIDDAEIDQIGDARYKVTLSVNGGAEEDILRGYIDYEARATADNEEEVPAAGVLLLEPGETVPANTPVDTVVFEKPSSLYTWDFTDGELPLGFLKRGSTSQTFDGTGMSTTLGSGAGFYIPISISEESVLDLEVTNFAAGDGTTMFGPTILDNSNNGMGATFYGNTGSTMVTTISGAVYAGDNRSTSPGPSAAHTLRIRRNGTSYYASSNTTGTFGTETVAMNSAVSPTRLGFGVTNGPAANAKIVSLRYESLSGPVGGNSLKGYWDGTQLKSL